MLDTVEHLENSLTGSGSSPIWCYPLSNSATPRMLHRLPSALEEAGMLGADDLEESGHHIEPVSWMCKVGQEAASGEARHDLGEASSAADAGDPGTCETTTVL